MNVVVQKAKHPELSSYIHSVTSGLHPFIQKVSSFLLSMGKFVIFSDACHVFEKLP